jgi:hypothetical protein
MTLPFMANSLNSCTMLINISLIKIELQTA